MAILCATMALCRATIVYQTSIECMPSAAPQPPSDALLFDHSLAGCHAVELPLSSILRSAPGNGADWTAERLAALGVEDPGEAHSLFATGPSELLLTTLRAMLQERPVQRCCGGEVASFAPGQEALGAAVFRCVQPYRPLNPLPIALARGEPICAY